MSKLKMMKPGLKKAAVAVLAGSWIGLSALSPATAGETRTLALYQVHTKESLTVTYKENGKFIPSAMKKLNYILRDWRRDAVTKMDPKTIDLMWELHADLGSKKPIHIISGYRSSKTNAMLKRIGRRVARRSRHIKGQAIDMYFPDVPTSRLRGSALVRKIGGVGYYPRSGKTGFVHIDSGNVRHWPRMSKARMAKIFSKYKKTVGARRYNKRPSILLASTTNGPTSITPAKLNKQILANAPVPKPRSRPIEVLALAAADLQVTPASAPVPRNNFASTVTRIRDTSEFTTATGPQETGQRSNIAAKGSLTKDILNGRAEGTPTIRPLITTASHDASETSSWWPLQILASADSLFRRDGSPQPFSHGESQVRTPTVTTTGQGEVLERMIASLTPDKPVSAPSPATAILGKADKLQVNRSGKSDLMMLAPVHMMKRQTITPAKFKTSLAVGFDSQDEAVMDSAETPLSFK